MLHNIDPLPPIVLNSSSNEIHLWCFTNNSNTIPTIFADVAANKVNCHLTTSPHKETGLKSLYKAL
ncbi:Uncharacterized protein ChrSV_1950 [Chromobacterium vaccinii]|nr:Uncharacterized protein ChrSW_1950 [Chromobacterium vaccinii]QND89408.1 Uncharacterized protein ChrSV_1950 [Chromobacterium vaccinii]